ncbi:hypothetical protein BDK51DRAFT_26566, partial [Blyttiomyces helicus]
MEGEVPLTLLHYSARRREVLIDNSLAANDALRTLLQSDPYFTRNAPKSFLYSGVLNPGHKKLTLFSALPIVNQGNLTAILYLENSLTKDAFTPRRIDLLHMVSSMTAASIENSLLYERVQKNNELLEEIVAERTKELQQRTARLETEIREKNFAQEALRQSKELAESATVAKSEFLANMSHEVCGYFRACRVLPIEKRNTEVHTGNQIRTPINAIMGMTACLLDTDLTSMQRDFVNIVYTSSDQLLSLLNDILDYSKIEARKLDLGIYKRGKKEAFELRGCVEGALDILARKATGKGLELMFDREDDVPESFIGDSGRLRQILVNLIGNAIKFTESGEIVITASQARMPESSSESQPASDAAETTHRNLWRLSFTVRDTGIGISREGMTRLFQTFTQIDASTTRLYGGTGLGLAISHRLSCLMGGEMWCTSDGQGAGSTFHFTVVFPSVDDMAVDEEIGVLRQKRALVIDDNATHRRVIQSLLRRWEMETIEASNEAEALEKLAKSPMDVCIIDMFLSSLQVADGLTLASQIRKRSTNLPLILMALYGSNPSPINHFSAILMKPLKKGQLKAALCEILSPSRSSTGGCSAEGSTTPSMTGTRKPQSKFPAGADIDPALPPLKILLVEDNVINQKVAFHLLKKLGQTARIAANGKALNRGTSQRSALASDEDVQWPLMSPHLKSNSGQEAVDACREEVFEVILMDVQMPVLDGYEATRVIRNSISTAVDTHIIGVTAHAMQGDRDACMSAGMDDYVTKPIRIHDLVAAIKKCKRSEIGTSAGESEDGEDGKSVDLDPDRDSGDKRGEHEEHELEDKDGLWDTGDKVGVGVTVAICGRESSQLRPALRKERPAANANLKLLSDVPIPEPLTTIGTGSVEGVEASALVRLLLRCNATRDPGQMTL